MTKAKRNRPRIQPARILRPLTADSVVGKPGLYYLHNARGELLGWVHGQEVAEILVAAINGQKRPRPQPADDGWVQRTIGG